jgi:alkylated DNA repair dioxygenase AlkB
MTEITGVPGLYYLADVVDAGMSDDVDLFLAMTEDWKSVGTAANSRQVIHYGYEYQYRTGKATKPTSPNPPIIESLRLRLFDLNFTIPTGETIRIPSTARMDQCIINQYLPGQGIKAHIDNASYDDWIACYTFQSGAIMEFTKGNQLVELYTRPNSLYIMSGESRFEWKHEQRARKYDTVNGEKISRGTRTSITFRTVLTHS